MNKNLCTALLHNSSPNKKYPIILSVYFIGTSRAVHSLLLNILLETKKTFSHSRGMTQNTLRKHTCFFCKHSIKVFQLLWTVFWIVLGGSQRTLQECKTETMLLREERKRKDLFGAPIRCYWFTLQADQRFVTYLPLSKFDCLRFPWVREHTCWCTGDPRLFWALSLFMTPELKAPGDLFCCGWPGLVLAPPGVMLSPGGRGNFGKDDACLKSKIECVCVYLPTGNFLTLY